MNQGFKKEVRDTDVHLRVYISGEVCVMAMSERIKDTG